ncbi:MAG: amidohydrolase family protein [Deltaproteobacteria bacterium]|nr:amidohydrolase family protein [Deltaproteobacteria bacterium]
MRVPSALLIRNGLIVTMNRWDEIFRGDIVIKGNKIAEIIKHSLKGGVSSVRGEGIPLGTEGTLPFDTGDVRVIDAADALVLPGFIQTHTHICQTLFRGMAEGVPLLTWLKKFIWPLEAALTEESLYAASLLGISELLRSGTTSILDMGTVRHTEAVFSASAEMGIRAWIGNVLMDSKFCPNELRESASQAVKRCDTLYSQWHGKENGRLHYAAAPRFALSCTENLLRQITAFAEERHLLIHTHAAEQEEEAALVKKETGYFNIEWHDRLGMTGPRLCLAHCVWPQEREIGILKQKGVKVLHCPSSNAKLASGIAPVQRYLKEEIAVSLGSDGAACNNALDLFLEMRAAAQLQSLKYGAGALSAKEIVAMATREGARALGKEAELGAIEKGYLADLVILDVSSPSVVSAASDPYTHLVFSAKAQDVRYTIVDGKVLVDERNILPLERHRDLREKAIQWRSHFAALV